MMFLSSNPINMPAILIANGLGGWLMCILLLDKRRRIQLAREEVRLFRAMCGLCLSLCLLETLTFCLDGQFFPGARVFCLWANAMIFVLDAIFAYLWVYYVSHKLFPRHPRLRLLHTWGALPALAVCVLSLSSPFTGFFFSMGPDNRYSRSPAVLIVYVITYLYLVSGAALSLYYQRRVDHSRGLPVGTFLLPVFVGSFIQFLCYGLALVWASVAVGLTSLHTVLLNEESDLDVLTGVYNRNYLIRYWDYATQRVRQGHHLTCMLLDINNFKSINDSFGHSVGDDVLCAVGHILRTAAGPRDVVTRYGGDEFVILAEDAPPERLHDTRTKIMSEIERYNLSGKAPCTLSLSVGTAALEDSTLNELFNRMDRAMYEEKRRHYERQAGGFNQK